MRQAKAVIFFLAFVIAVHVSGYTSLRLSMRIPAVTHRGRSCFLVYTGGAADWESVYGDNSGAAGNASPGGPTDSWRRVGDCDILLPADDEQCIALVHFVGGAVVGAAPRQAYGPFLEMLCSLGLGVVATPCTLLSGLNHDFAAAEVAARWSEVLPEVESMLDARELFDKRREARRSLPVVGCGHSLGAKLLLLLGSDGVQADVGERLANVLVAFNNYPASASVPLLQGASQLDQFITTDNLKGVARGAGVALEQLGDLGSQLGPQLQVPMGESLRGAISDAANLFSQLGNGAQKFAESTSASGDAAASEFEFSPSPAETEARVADSYNVRRNLLIRFADDQIDQSPAIGHILRKRFTDAQTGIGGRVDLKTLPGTHITPNLPVVRGLEWSVVDGVTALGGAQELAERLAFEQEATCAVIAGFVEREVERSKQQP